MILRSRGEINFEYLGLLILALFPIFPYSVLSTSILLCLACTILEYFRTSRKRQNSAALKRKIIAITLFYFVLIGFTLFHQPSLYSISAFQASLPILGFAVVWYFFSSLSLSQQQIKNIFLAFVGSSFVLGLIITISTIDMAITINLPFFDMVRKSLENFKYLDLHPVYVSQYFIFSCLYLVHNLDRKNKISYLILIIFFILLILLIASRIAIIAFALLMSHKFLSSKFKKSTIFAYVAFALILIIGILTVKPLQVQFKEMGSLDKFELPYKRFPTSPQIRLGIYECSIEIIKQYPLLGLGAIAFEDKLNSCYQRYRNHDRINYNSHNYFIFLLGASGIIGLFAFIVSLLTQFRMAQSASNTMFFYFTFIICTLSFTENILSRSQGATFFVFCLSIFLSSNKNLQES